MNSKLWIRKALTLCMMVALVATYSMVGLANTEKAAGELIVTGNNAGGETPFVMVNGEAAKSGRTIFSSSTISTPDGTGAIVNLGKAGKLELSPKTTLVLSFDDAMISGELASGTITVLNAAQSVNIRTSMGNNVVLNAGDTASAETGKTKGKDDDDDDKGGAAWWVWALIGGGAIAGILYASMNSNDYNIGGNGTVISPTR